MVRKIVLSDEQRKQLSAVLKSDPKAYRREQAAAILKVADGQIAAHVARSGLLRVRDPDTVTDRTALSYGRSRRQPEAGRE